MKELLNDKRINNTWAIIPISELPENFPILAVSQFAHKKLAEFHLVEFVLVPKELESKFAKPEKKPTEPEINVEFPPQLKIIDEKPDL